jgi:hypothetical protein
MFVPCIIKRNINNQHYTLIFTTSLFYILASTAETCRSQYVE